MTEMKDTEFEMFNMSKETCFKNISNSSYYHLKMERKLHVLIKKLQTLLYHYLKDPKLSKINFDHLYIKLFHVRL